MMYDFIIDIFHSIWRNGFSLTALGAVVFVILRQRKVKRKLKNLMPMLFSDDSEVKEYVGNQVKIMQNQRVIMRQMGVEGEWNGNTEISKSEDPQSLKRLFSLSQVAKSHQFTRRKKRMNKWIKPDKLTILIGIIITASNEYFGWTLDTANVGAFFFMLFSFFKQQEIIRIVRYAHGLPVAFKINSTKLIFTILGVLIVALDQLKGIGLGLPEIIAIVAFVTGYNIKEGEGDVKKAEREGQLHEEHISTSEFEG